MAVDPVEEPASIADLFAPLSAQDFLCVFYGRRPLHLTGDPSRFASIFSWDALNQVLESHVPQPPRLRVIKLGNIDPQQYSNSVRHGRDTITRLNWQLLHDQMRAGATLKLDDVDEMHAPLSRLCRNLELELCNRVQVNVYASWFQQQGFPTHWDDHDVFIAQIAGPKHWRIFEPTRKFPITEDYKLPLVPPPHPCWEGDLQPGEILYIPRGWWHDAVPCGQPTLHLTFGMYRETGIDLTRALLHSLIQEEVIRADLPRFAPAEEQERYLSAFRERVISALDSLSLGSYYRESDANAPARMRPSLPHSIVPEGATFSPSSWLQWLPPRHVPFEAAGDAVVFKAMGREFRFQQSWARVLIDLASHRCVQFGSLYARHSDSEEDLRRFMLELVSGGLIAVTN